MVSMQKSTPQVSHHRNIFKKYYLNISSSWYNNHTNSFSFHAIRTSCGRCELKSSKEGEVLVPALVTFTRTLYPLGEKGRSGDKRWIRALL